MKLVVGLGNPGISYQGTRHNAGFSVLELLAFRHRMTFSRDRECRSLVAVGEMEDHQVVLMMPQTYMNLSGEAVVCFLRKKQISLSDLLVVVDDVAIPFNSLRCRAEGSSGGHNGLKNIELHLQTMSYARLRVGVGNPGERELVDYVLAPFTSEEQEHLPELFGRAADAVELWVREGISSVMNKNLSK